MDNGGCYKSHAFKAVCTELGIQHARISRGPIERRFGLGAHRLPAVADVALKRREAHRDDRSADDQKDDGRRDRDRPASNALSRDQVS